MTVDAPIFVRAGPQFARVVEAFQENFRTGMETGAAFSVMIEGECVVDLHGGFTDHAGEIRWGDQTLAPAYSCGKAVMATLIARAVSDGLLDYEAPVATVWPEFAQNGKGAITLAEVLSHQAGLCGFVEPMPPETWLDHEAITAKLAAMAPLWAPGSASGYHPQTVGFIVNELLLRTDGRSIGAILRQDYLMHDVHCGIDAEMAQRSAAIRKPPRPPDFGEINVPTEVAFLKPWSAPARIDRNAWMAAEIPASNMQATARGLAAIVHPLACRGMAPGAPDIAGDAVAAALRPRTSGPDLVLPFTIDWSAGLMGNIIDIDGGVFGPSPGALGHGGHGGSAILVDPARRLSAAYIMNRMSHHLVGDPRARRLFASLYAPTTER